MNDPTNPSQPTASVSGESRTIPLVEERIKYTTQREETGKVRITKQVREETIDVEESLTQEKVNVKRVPVDRFVDEAPPSVRHEGDVMIVPVVEEVLVKRLRLVEEIHIRKTTETRTDTDEVVLRKEQLVVERETPETKD